MNRLLSIRPSFITAGEAVIKELFLPIVSGEFREREETLGALSSQPGHLHLFRSSRVTHACGTTVHSHLPAP